MPKRVRSSWRMAMLVCACRWHDWRDQKGVWYLPRATGRTDEHEEQQAVGMSDQDVLSGSGEDPANTAPAGLSPPAPRGLLPRPVAPPLLHLVILTRPVVL